MDLRVRKGGVKEWKDAAKFGIEVYRDNTTGNLVYISETGAIAVVLLASLIPALRASRLTPVAILGEE